MTIIVILINAGAIMCCSLIDEGKSIDHKLKTVLGYWKRLVGNETKCEINQEMYESESKTADRNRCLAYMMNEYGGFPNQAILENELEFYFMCCSQMQTTESMAIVAGTLANGGRCPTTNERIFSPETVQSVLSVMFTCGMYDYSGQFSFSMGFPAKSGVAGAILIVIPNVMGICTWSPRLDLNGNSVRGILYARGLANIYQIHNFDKVSGKMKVLSKTNKEENVEEEEGGPANFTTGEEKNSHPETNRRISQLDAVTSSWNVDTSQMKINPLFRPCERESICIYIFVDI